MLPAATYTIAAYWGRTPSLACVSFGMVAFGMVPGRAAQDIGGIGLRAPLDPANAQQIASLFDPHELSAPPPALAAEYTALGQATVDFTALDRCAAGSQLSLDLSPTVAPTFTVDRVERRSPSQYSVFARSPDESESFAILVREHDALAMTVSLSDQPVVYRTRFLGDGVHQIVALRTDEQLRCGGSPPASSAPPPSRVVPPELIAPAPGDTGVVDRGFCLHEPMRYDVMVLYTGAALDAAGGVNAMNAEVQQVIDLTNLAYANSEIETRARLVYRGSIFHNEGADADVVLNQLTDDNDAFLDQAHVLRDQYRADVVALWVNDLNYCGIAWCSANADTAFSVTKWDCHLSHAHEIGHNQGCNHDADNATATCEHSWSRGWRFTGSNGGLYHTVMSYMPGIRIPHFSNPDVLYRNTPTGVPAGAPDGADNARTVNETDGRVRDFRLTRMDIWVDFAFGGVETGSFGNPYNTMAEGAAAVLEAVGGSELPSLRIKAGTTTAPATISRAMVLRGCGGVVRIGG